MTNRVLIVDDHRLVAVALSYALRAEGFEVEVAASPERKVVLDAVEVFRPGCVLLDLHLGSGMNGLDLIGPLRQGGAQVLMLTSERDELVLAAGLEAGALGWLAKDADFESVGAAVKQATEGVPLLGRARSEELLCRLRDYRRRMSEAASPFERLSLREQVVLEGLMEGMSAEEIAEAETVSLATVRTQIRSMLQKLGVHSQLAAVAHARKAGWQPRNRTDTQVHQ